MSDHETNPDTNGPSWKYVSICATGILTSVIVFGMGLTSNFVYRFSSAVQTNTQSIVKIDEQIKYLKEGQDDIKDMLKAIRP